MSCDSVFGLVLIRQNTYGNACGFYLLQATSHNRLIAARDPYVFAYVFYILPVEPDGMI